jgi:uncharacterized damage-inducible protein DinB
VNDTAVRLARAVATEFRRRVCNEYVPRIGRCLDSLTEAQCWQRPGSRSNSVANLLMHLAGNVRQWILVGIGGQPDERNRAFEFAAHAGEAGATAPELFQRLSAVAAAAADVVDRMTPEELLTERTFQGRFHESGLAGVVHVLEHFSGHAGQIYAYTKQVTGEDLQFYDL